MHGGDNGGMSQYQALTEQEWQDKLLKQQIRKHGEEEMQVKPMLRLLRVAGCLPILCSAHVARPLRRYHFPAAVYSCTSGPVWSGVGPAGTPDQTSPEVHRRSAVEPRPRSLVCMGSADLARHLHVGSS